ncbi:nickel-dependent hydrogenase large subunit [Desulfobacterales bacterium HSG17]|nr:nickel-dependent hydrogenase large subunit [Desulfobacterales bacterium HSG17]
MPVKTKLLNIPLNRVEGDLEIKVSVQDGRVTDAYSSGLMFRGFENILKGRGALDGLVITPRICGICTTAHLTAAAKALDMIAGVSPPPDAVRLRNLALAVEQIQSDMRHAFLMFFVDFTNNAYQDHPLYEQAVKLFTPFSGEAVVEVIRETKKVLGIIAVIGGQWPHSSYMIPGGIVSVPGALDIKQCRLLLESYRQWYETKVLGCTLERWQQVQKAADLDTWLDESPSHKNSYLGFYIRFARDIGLDQIGRGHENFISVGTFDQPESDFTTGTDPAFYWPAGFAQGIEVESFNQGNISEHIKYSWYENNSGNLHPGKGMTSPYASGEEGLKYSWAKAPRYNDLPAETGPLAQQVIAGDPLVTDYITQNRSNVFIRELARLVRPVQLIPTMREWLTEITPEGEFYVSPNSIPDGEGFGLAEVTRGALGHWVGIENNKIEHYQIITPTAWNGSPRDANHIRGPWEEALIGGPVKDPENPVELGHIIRSFDACLVCTVHCLEPLYKETGKGKGHES